MAAIFQLQSANWEETQEKMSQSVSPLGASSCPVVVFSNALLYPFHRGPFSPFSVKPGFIRIHVERALVAEASRLRRPTTNKTSDRSRPVMCATVVGRKVCLPVFDSLLIPPEAVPSHFGCKGHWIQDCPTNDDREFDNKPRIKRTTGIPRSFLKAVDNPGGARIGQGVMVTPEGGYVVAQPDS
jgi:hypothetical protein